MIDVCPICKSKEWKYTHYTEECWGIVEQHGYCNHCGYMIEQCYSDEKFFYIISEYTDYGILKDQFGIKKNIQKIKQNI